jgi:hypothetical protein
VTEPTPLEQDLTDARLRLQQILAIGDDHVGEPAYIDAAETIRAEIADLQWRQAQFEAKYVPSLADTHFYS